VLGFINDTTFVCRRFIDDRGGFGHADLDALNHRIRRNLHHRDGYHTPLDLVAQSHRAS